MPLTEGDVLDTLSDPVALGIEFYVDKIHIKGEYLTTVRDHIRAGNILVKGGTEDLAFYDQTADILLTQKKSPPANDGDRALLLHECVHAMIDVYDPDGTVTRHMGELAAYLTQTTYSVRKNPSANRTGTAAWDKFWGDMYATVRTNRLDTSAGNGVRIPSATLENLRRQLAALPSVNYGSFSKEATGVSDGLIRMNIFLSTTDEPVSMRSSSVAYESNPDPSDDYLIRTLMEAYASTDVRGYGKRLRQLRRDFLFCSLPRAHELRRRLSLRKRGDRLSELFHDRLSRGGRAILLRVLALRS
ncbi:MULTISPECIES: hypothetical protein [unclassified Bradyrhizobium]|uniref:hypothetical protein n=1 Tax=unclassified Bradyrhizobium TaxID=2631580 RepID=UPI0030D167BA